MTGMTYKHTGTPIFSFFAEMTNEFLKNKKPKNKKYFPKVIKIVMVVASNTPIRILFEFLKNI